MTSYVRKDLPTLVFGDADPLRTGCHVTVLACEACGALVLPDTREAHDEHHGALNSLLSTLVQLSPLGAFGPDFPGAVQ